ncbi:MAG: hypothetical protein N4J56_004943 [Chroococcidiopsis sp. SAG 2025]|uniref:GAF domain-containing protein n=1 Tax=Chroococcidiopsis sp. SAG 2025 TaxID=171389 RepID=UPI002936FEED|nr:GAF domain-containing protein [Chroococcidiopsis sp. SAG 2025]MDV2995289.1 hypothetical protein [Chroococcidiopsis sp. SAG 2025]
MLLYLFKEHDAALESAELAERYTDSILGFMTLANHNFYYSLSLLSQYTRFSNKVKKGKAIAQKQVLKIVESNQKKMKEWATHAPKNYQHKYDLVEAEKARYLDNFVKAEEYYDRAIKGAKATGYIQDLALANELAAEFYFSRNRTSTAEIYLIQSYYGYVRWGAKSKSEDLAARYPEFFAQLLRREQIDLQLGITSNSKTNASSSILDTIATAKALEIIAGEVVFDRLISQFLYLAIENTGATGGLLFLSNNNKLDLAATKSIDTEAQLFFSEQNVEQPHFPISLINYVTRTTEKVVVNDAAIEGLFTHDSYIVATQAKSICCLPLTHKEQFIGILYLENSLAARAFSDRHLIVLKLLTAQAAMCLARNIWTVTSASR